MTCEFGATRLSTKLSDPWVSGFADRWLDEGAYRSFPATLALRASHPEPFWTKLSLIGVKRVNVGIETLSEPLLKKINKGTRAVQDIRVHKYLKELGVQTEAYLITKHPKSTPDDVVKTKRVIDFIPHLDRFLVGGFRLVEGSPPLEELDEKTRTELDVFHAVAPRVAQTSSGFNVLQVSKSVAGC